MPQEIGAAPAVAHHLSVRPSIRVNQHGIFLLRTEIPWLDDAGVERNAIVRLHRQKFHRRKVVIREFGHSVLVDRGDARAVSAIKILALRRGGIRIGVVEGRSVGRKDRSMCSGLLSDGSKGCAVERYSIEVALKQRFFGCREIDQALCFIHAVER